ncbi:hypothetical protein, partial [Nocardia carnea]|uniref:hypothetical protein n=1 Tax=Nocardia carnea TaxID=37328 RepID=UPI002456B30E
MLVLLVVATALIGLILMDTVGPAVGAWFLVASVVLAIAAGIRTYRRNRAPLRAKSRSAGAGSWFVGDADGSHGGGRGGGCSGSCGCGGVAVAGYRMRHLIPCPDSNARGARRHMRSRRVRGIFALDSA